MRHGLSLFGILIDRNSGPDHLPLFEEAVVGVAIVLVDECEEIINDGRGGDSALIVAVVVQETINEDVLQGLGIDPEATPEPSATPSATPTPTPAPTATPTPTYQPTPTPTQGGYSYGGGQGCYLPGTLISMADGTFQNIESLKIGDQILSYDLEKQTAVGAPVTETFKHENNPGGYLIINGFKITPNHPMWLNGGWIPAGEASIGDYMLNEDGSKKRITDIKFIPGIFTVYNFEVEETHAYFAYSVLTHNYNDCDPNLSNCSAGQPHELASISLGGGMTYK